jgi:hypothetical protein
MAIISEDWLEFIRLLNAKGVEYLIVGGHAVALHGRARLTQDIDFYCRRSDENVARLMEVLDEFGFATLGLSSSDFLSNFGVQLGYAPNRIDIVMAIEGVEFDEAQKTRVAAEIGGLNVWVISKDLLIKNKLALGRPRDLADVHDLTQSESEGE